MIRRIGWGLFSAIIALLIVVALLIGLVWTLFGRIDELKAERTDLRAKQRQCLKEQGGLTQSFESTIDFLNRRTQEIETRLQNELKECRKNSRQEDLR